MLVKTVRTTQVEDFQKFLEEFDLASDKKAGEDGTDEELIAEMLEQVPGLWFMTFVDYGEGYFSLSLISDDQEDQNEEIVQNWVGIEVERKGVSILVGISPSGKMNYLEWLDKDDPAKEWTEEHIYGRTVKGSERVFDDNDKLILDKPLKWSMEELVKREARRLLDESEYYAELRESGEYTEEVLWEKAMEEAEQNFKKKD